MVSLKIGTLLVSVGEAMIRASADVASGLIGLVFAFLVY